MRKTLIVCALTLALAACDKGNAPAAGAADTAAPVASAADIAAESKRLNEWFDKKYEEQLKFSPIQLTFQGRKDLYDQVDDMSEQAQRDQVAWQKASVEEMEKTFDYAKLDDEAKLSYDLWKLQYENARDPEEKVPHPLAGQGAAYSPQLARVWSLWRTVYSRPALYRAFSWLATRLRVFTPRRQLGWTVHRTPLTPAKQSLHELVRQRQSSR